MVLTIEQSGDTFKGRSEYTSKVNGSMSETFEGNIVDGIITIQEQEVTEGTNHYLWCVKRFTGQVIAGNKPNEMVMYGKWNSGYLYDTQRGTYNYGYCAPGEFRCVRTIKPSSRIRTLASTIRKDTLPQKIKGKTSRSVSLLKEHINTSGKLLRIEIFDADINDGDRASIFFNDVKIVSDVLLHNRYKKVIYVELKKGRNTLVLQAENLGDYPPNTASLNLYSGNRLIKNVRLTSDLVTSQGLVIKR